MKSYSLTFAALLLASPVAAQPQRAQIRMDAVQQADGTRALAHELLIKAPVTKVWQAVSTVEGWRTWSAPLAWKISSRPEVWETSFSPAHPRGHRENVRHLILGKVPDRLLIFRTIKAPASFRGGEILQNVTWALELIPQGNDATLVRITGVGFPGTRAGLAAHSFFEQVNSRTFENMRHALEVGPVDWRDP